MITVKVNKIAATPYQERDFYRSLLAQTSGPDVYELIASVPEEFAPQVNVVTKPSSSSRIVITLPDSCIVLGKDWDKYINWMLDNKKLIKTNDAKDNGIMLHEVLRRLNVVDRGNTLIGNFSIDIVSD